MKFTKPDAATVKRMTVQSITSLLGSLKSQRAELVKPYDDQIKFYEDLLENKKREVEQRNQVKLPVEPDDA